jgi:hypothetical protein
MAALDKGPVKFIISMDNVDSTSTNIEVVTTSMFDGESYICVYSTPSYDLFFVIYNGGISLGAFINNIGGSSLPEVSTDDDGKVLTVVDGTWQAADAQSAPASIDMSAFDSEGKIVETFVDGTNKTTVVEFDASGNPVKITDGDGNVTVLTW